MTCKSTQDYPLFDIKLLVCFMYFFYFPDTRAHLIVQNVRSNLHEDLIFSFIFRKVVLKRSATRTGRQTERNTKNMVSAVQHRTKSLNFSSKLQLLLERDHSMGQLLKIVYKAHAEYAIVFFFFFWHLPDILSNEQGDICWGFLSLARHFKIAGNYMFNYCRTL